MKIGKIEKELKVIEYKIFKRSKKNVILKVDLEGQIEVSIPKRVSYKTAEGIISDNFDKIYQKSMEKKQSALEKVNKDSIKILGSDFKKSGRNPEDILIEKSHKVFHEILEKWIPIIGVTPKKIKIRKMKTAWGICYSNGNVTLNLKLIQMDIKIIEYVIIHELCHFYHMNHSKEFWNLVEKHLPDFKEERRRLKIIQRDYNYFE